MAIESITGKTINGTLPARAASKADAAAKASVEKTGADVSIQLTAAAKDMSAVNSSQSDSIDEARVAAIKTAIENGSYRIDPERVAKKMLQFEEKLPDST